MNKKLADALRAYLEAQRVDTDRDTLHGMRDGLRTILAEYDTQAATGVIRADGKELVGHDWDNGPEAWDVIRDDGEQWLAYANPEFTARIVAALNAQPVTPAGAHTAETWRASDYACSGGSTGACVMVGDDTVLDLPYGEAWPDDVQNYRARRIAACVNACAGVADPSRLVAALRDIVDSKGSATFNDDLEAYDSAVSVARAALGEDA